MSREYIILNLGLWTCIQYTYYVISLLIVVLFLDLVDFSIFFILILFVTIFWCSCVLSCWLLFQIPSIVEIGRTAIIETYWSFFNLFHVWFFFIYYSMHIRLEFVNVTISLFLRDVNCSCSFQYLDRMKCLSTICIGTICFDSDNILFLPSYYISDSLHCLVPTQWNLYLAISL